MLDHARSASCSDPISTVTTALGNLWHVYVLRDPRDSAIRYVGVTQMGPNDRLHRHVSEALRRSKGPSRSPKDAWVLDLLDAHMRPAIEVVERVEGARIKAGDREKHWRRKLAAEGAQLLNGGGKTKRGAWGGIVGKLREALARDGIVVAEKHTMTQLQRLEKKGEAKSLRGSSVFLRPDVHEAVERALVAARRG